MFQDFADRSVVVELAALAERIAQASDRGEIQGLLHRATVALGAERSFFASMRGDGIDRSYAFVLDSDPAWWHRYRAACPLEKNPWLIYATRHSAPTRTTRGTSGAEPRQSLGIASDPGFVSALLLPAHSGRLHHRVSLLCFGHSTAGYFEHPSFSKVQVTARSFAMELHDWWAVHEQRELAQRTHLSEAEVRLLSLHAAGLSSKQIANEMNVSCESINSRFQRIIAKLGVRNRRAAARLAVECGLIVE